MTLANSVLLGNSLPFRVRMVLLWNRFLRYTKSLTEERGNPSIALEKEFKTLIERENAIISRICFSYSSSLAEFDDLRQDALINIWRGLQGFRGEAARKTWVYRVTVNSCLSTIRKELRHKHDSLEGLYGLIESDDSDKENFEQMHRIISSLAPQDRAIIMMWLDELGYEDIAAAMGLNRNTIATKIRRIKEKIAKAYKTAEVI